MRSSVRRSLVSNLENGMSMGKKSRIKREKRERLSSLLSGVKKNQQQAHDQVEQSFSTSVQALQKLFSEYSSSEVLNALNISDLWLPNIASQVKHIFAYVAAISMSQEQFSGQKQLDSYTKFCEFVKAVYLLTPRFSVLEDFIPETDWGDVYVTIKGQHLAIFYGGNVERISDFVEAFFLLFADQSEALKDMELAITLQHQVIKGISFEVLGNANDILPGHVEVPAESFWTECSNVLHHIIEVFPTDFSPSLIINHGSLKHILSHDAFGNAVMQGMALPAIIVNSGGKLIPISLRNSLSIVIDYWATREANLAPSEMTILNKRIGNFLAQRLDQRNVINGPIKLVSREENFPPQMAAVLKSGQKFYLVLILKAEQIQRLDILENKLKRILANDWALILEDGKQVVEIVDGEGSKPSFSDIQILTILPKISTAGIHLRKPKTDAQILFLPDFISIFDSLNDIQELDKFLTYVGENDTIFGLIGLTDLFASFRDTHNVLIDGAFEPTIISLDPHWGSNWRFKELKSFWKDAPKRFPDDQVTWKLEPTSEGLQRLIAKGTPTLAWSTLVGDTTVQIILEVLSQDLDSHNGRLLELLVHCLCDAISQKSGLLQDAGIFNHQTHVVITCEANIQLLANLEDDDQVKMNSINPLFNNWRISKTSWTSKTKMFVEVNLSKVQSLLDSPIDASFEILCLTETIDGVVQLLGKESDQKLKRVLASHSTKKPRFTLKRVSRTVDVPDFCDPAVPQPEQYKLARRDLAIVLKQQNVDAPSKYELKSAKGVIDSAREAMRKMVHERAAAFDRNQLLLFCIEQHDKLAAQYRDEVFRLKQSLNHEVSYDRSKAMAEAYERFTKVAKNYRYLLECCVSAQSMGNEQPQSAAVVQLIATIDWLFVLYDASDVLHNDIDVAGIELDSAFVPKVFYSQDREEKEHQFSLESAQAKLGINLISEDQVNSTMADAVEQGSLDYVFELDLGFKFTHLLQALLILSQWNQVGGDSNLRFCYQAPIAVVTEKFTELIDGLSASGARLLIEFLILRPKEVRRLIGKSVDEVDVPVWEHNKRGSRCTIRPLVTVGNEAIAWGAMAAERTFSIWNGAIADGYLPADFNWPNVKAHVRGIKVDLEKKLEDQAFSICSRYLPYVVKGMDFKKKFPKEKFPDVGDFDVLAYWPENNQLLTIECKYNQPPYCLKDARRLRERIFGIGEDKGQFAKIEGRAEFLKSHIVQVRELLGWPLPSTPLPLFTDVYVGRDISWWMRNPPYEVSSNFVRVDALDHWIISWLKFVRI